MERRVAVTIEFELPFNRTVTECADLVLKQMRVQPVWDEPGGTGNLNYVCYDRTMEIVSAKIVEPAARRY